MITRTLVLALLAGSALWCADSAAVSDTEEKDAGAYCTQTGGVVETLSPVYGTNGPSSSWLWLAGYSNFCQYTARDGSRIHVLLKTLTSTRPTLAALAYYSETPYAGGNGAPGSFYCSQLGGTDLFGGVTAAGGGWVGGTGPDYILDSCIFPDLSSIDSYGLFYHSAAIIRGIDLAKVLKYKNPYKK